MTQRRRGLDARQPSATTTTALPSCPCIALEKMAAARAETRTAPAPGSILEPAADSMMHLTDPDQIRAWWRSRPDSNIGIRTGAESGLIVLDVDPDHGGDESLAQLEALQGPLPATVQQRTGGGGRHYLFQHPGISGEEPGRIPARLGCPR